LQIQEGNGVSCPSCPHSPKSSYTDGSGLSS